jgi:hypothetical protein
MKLSLCNQRFMSLLKCPGNLTLYIVSFIFEHIWEGKYPIFEDIKEESAKSN